MLVLVCATSHYKQKQAQKGYTMNNTTKNNATKATTTNKATLLKEARLTMKSDIEQAKEINVHQVPTKDLHSGKDGQVFEYMVKLAIGNTNFIGIAKQGVVDTRKKIGEKLLKIEIKQGAGELATLNRDGSIKTSILKSDLIIVTSIYSLKKADVLKCAYVFNTEDFINLVDELGLIRYKVSSNQLRKAKSDSSYIKYHDKMTLQTLSNSPSRLYEYELALAEHGTRLDKWLSDNNIKPSRLYYDTLATI